MENPAVESLPEMPEEKLAMPLPSDLRTIFLGGLFILALLAAIRIASEIIIPIVLAFVLKLVLQPVYRFLGKWQIPSAMAAGIIIIALVCGIIGLGTLLSGPAASWAAKLPGNYPQLQERLHFLSTPVEKTQQILVQAEDMTQGVGPQVVPVAVQGTRLSDKVFTGTQSLIAGIFTTMLVLFFLLASGDTFLRRLVEVLPKFKDKRQAVDISQQVEQDISSYLLTITAMNAAVGVATGLMMWAFHVDDPLLWGALAFLLNYIPIIGTIIGVMIFLFVGLLTVDHFVSAFMPAILYFTIHLIEKEKYTVVQSNGGWRIKENQDYIR